MAITLRRNEHMAAWSKPLRLQDEMGARPSAIPAGLSRVPFVWNYLGSCLPMHFVAGFVGVAQDEDTLALRPGIGWAVRDAKERSEHSLP